MDSSTESMSVGFKILLAVLISGKNGFFWAFVISAVAGKSRPYVVTYFILCLAFLATDLMVDPVYRLSVIVSILQAIVSTTQGINAFWMVVFPYLPLGLATLLGFAAWQSYRRTMEILCAITEGRPLIPGVEEGTMPTITQHSIDTTEADRKAEEILLAHLDADQRISFTRYGYFLVRVPLKDGPDNVTGASCRLFRITSQGRSGNVREVDPLTLTEVSSYCVYPNDTRLPQCDVMLAQKLMLEHDFEGFLDTANEMRERRTVEPRQPAVPLRPAVVPDRLRFHTMNCACPDCLQYRVIEYHQRDVGAAHRFTVTVTERMYDEAVARAEARADAIHVANRGALDDIAREARVYWPTPRADRPLNVAPLMMNPEVNEVWDNNGNRVAVAGNGRRVAVPHMEDPEQVHTCHCINHLNQRSW